MTKIAITTDDGQTVSSHFGQARYFKVVLIGDPQNGSVEMREKPSHEHGHAQDEPGVIHPGQAMLEMISDCQVLVTGGMGEPAFCRALEKNIQVILTSEKQIDRVLEEYQKGTLMTDERRIHRH